MYWRTLIAGSSILHARDASRRRVGDGRLVRRLLQFRRRALDVLDGTRRVAVALHDAPETLRGLRQLRDDGGGIIRQRIDPVPQPGGDHHDDQPRGDDPRHVNPRDHRDDRLQRIADEDAQDDRDERLLRPVQQVHRRGDGEHGERDAADADVSIRQGEWERAASRAMGDRADRFRHVSFLCGSSVRPALAAPC